MKKSINIVNKKAKFEYSFLETLIVGIQLVGSEVKSIRQGKVSISEGYCFFNNGELFMKGILIQGNGNDNIGTDKKLLLKI
jgi:SsrA-binding protein